MTSGKLRQAHGNWVEGDRFWDRKQDTKLLIEKIDEGAHILLVAQRRMGKTSLMKEVARLLGERYDCFYIDLEKASTSEDAIVELSLALKPHAKFWDKVGNIFANVLSRMVDKIEELNLGEVGIKLRAGLTASNWSEKGDALLSMLADSERPVLLLIDEVPLLVNRILKGEDFKITKEQVEKTDEFLSWLRKNSQRHQGRIRIILSGSIGLEPILHQAGLSATINNFMPFDLKPWDKQTAVECLDALANQYGIEFINGAGQAMIERIGCAVPHHVQMFFTHVYDYCKRRGKTVFSLDEVDAIYDTEMLGIRGHAELTHYEERLKLVLGPETLPLALELLTEAAVVGCLPREAITAIQAGYNFAKISARDATMEILRVLEHDGYLKSGKDGYVFVSDLLKGWWHKRYGFFHVPVNERMR